MPIFTAGAWCNVGKSFLCLLHIVDGDSALLGHLLEQNNTEVQVLNSRAAVRFMATCRAHGLSVYSRTRSKHVPNLSSPTIVRAEQRFLHR